ncbi:pyridoxal phosphate-dependent transferase [Elsinoe ampelina]|uniref:phosphoserine transaminase n=1 Tax=Elsinoe ampelina TaxID=302913 RepID=A0A6A6FZX7_9PEZI|nr:pyridoxal phosphate-dependent transferase [Elsinoe ampelina]
MPSREEVAYFGAGPAPLPTEVLENASKVLLNYNDSGIGITEISHRSPEANAILASAQTALRNLLDIPNGDGPDGYQILFLQGGGSGEFSASVYHMVGIWVERRRKEIVKELGDGASDEDVFDKLKVAVDNDMKIDYLVTGSWSLKASQEAARLVGSGPVNVAVDARKSRGGKFGVIPPESEWKLSPKPADSAMVYFCDNETVDGVEFPAFPTCLADGSRPVVADMSSNFISRKVDVKKYSAIFGGAQKNIGTTGITIAIIKNTLLPPHSELAKPDLLRRLQLPVGPVVLDWPTIAKNNSLYNTLPIFDVWVAGQVMEGLVARHGGAQPKIQGQQDESDQKAKSLYGVLEAYPQLYHVVPDASVRSRMNVCFRIGGDTDRDAKEKAFLTGASELKLLGCKGHRSVGGIRISNYNAVSPQKIEKLVAYIDRFGRDSTKQ